MNELFGSLGTSIVFGLVGIILLIFAYWFFDMILTKIDFNEELKKNNTAIAIVIAGFMIAIGIIISGVVS